MTATDELRRMLDERGVEWGIADYSKHKRMTVWHVDGMEWKYFEDDKTGWTVLDSRRDYLTPAQAIEVTLGRGTCHLKEIDKDCDTASEYMLAREWCFDAVYRCSCGCRFGHISHDRPHFCPNCGAEVVS